MPNASVYIMTWGKETPCPYFLHLCVVSVQFSYVQGKHPTVALGSCLDDSNCVGTLLLWYVRTEI